MKSYRTFKSRAKTGNSGNPFFDVLHRNFMVYWEARKIVILKNLRPFQIQNMILSRLREISQLPKLVHKHVRLRNVASFTLAALPYILYLIIFKFYTPLRQLTHLDVLSPPTFTVLPKIEEHLFFCQPHKVLSQFATPLLDFLAGIPYLIHFPLPFLFGAYLAFHPGKRNTLRSYMWCAGWVNFIAVLLQFTFPTASPWFVDSAIVDEHGHVIYEYANEAGFKRLDKIMGFAVFHGIYSHSPLKFGAFPSLHVAWPMIVFLNHPWFGKKLAGLHVVWITLAAVYSTQHYLTDAVAGILLVIIVRLSIVKLWCPFPGSVYPESRENGSRDSPTSRRTATGVTINI